MRTCGNTIIEPAYDFKMQANLTGFSVIKIMWYKLLICSKCPIIGDLLNNEINKTFKVPIIGVEIFEDHLKLTLKISV